MKCTVFYNDKQIQPTANKMSFFEELYFDFKVSTENNHHSASLFIHPKQSIKLSKVVVEIPYNFNSNDSLFCNGFQSWSESKTYKINQKIQRLRKIAKPYFQYYGDEHMFDESAPDLYSWTYGYVKRCLLYTSPSPRDRG